MLAHWAESVLFRNKSNNACKHIFGSIENTKKKQKKKQKKKKKIKKSAKNPEPKLIKYGAFKTSRNFKKKI